MLDKITDTSLRRLRVDRITEIKDKGAGSSSILYCRAMPSGSKIWHVRYGSPIKRAASGRKQQQRKVLGEFPALRRDDARLLALDIETSIAHGVDPLNEDQQSTIDATVREVFDEYQKRHLSDLSQKRRSEVIRMFENYVFEQSSLDAVVIDRINRRMADKVWQDILDRGKSRQALEVFQTLRHFFNWAVQRNYITDSPMAHSSNNIGKKSRERFMVDDEIKSFMNNMSETKISPQIQTILKLLVLTGQRVGEVCSIELNELNLDDYVWHIPSHKAKNGHANKVPLTNMSVSLIHAAIENGLNIRGDSEFLFATVQKATLEEPARIVSQRIDAISQAMGRSHNQEVLGTGAKIVKGEKLPAITPHDLRRTVATKMGDIGIPPHIIEKLLNHVSGVRGGIAGVYQRSELTSEVKEAMEAWHHDLKRLTVFK